VESSYVFLFSFFFSYEGSDAPPEPRHGHPFSLRAGAGVSFFPCSQTIIFFSYRSGSDTNFFGHNPPSLRNRGKRAVFSLLGQETARLRFRAPAPLLRYERERPAYLFLRLSRRRRKRWRSSALSFLTGIFFFSLDDGALPGALELRSLLKTPFLFSNPER